MQPELIELLAHIKGIKMGGYKTETESDKE